MSNNNTNTIKTVFMTDAFRSELCAQVARAMRAERSDESDRVPRDASEEVSIFEKGGHSPWVNKILGFAY